MIAVIMAILLFTIQAAIAWSNGDDSGKWLVIIVCAVFYNICIFKNSILNINYKYRKK